MPTAVRAEALFLVVLALGVLGFAHEYIDPRKSGIPVGIDIGNDLSYLGILRSEFLESGRLATWWSTAYDGMPLLGHPNTQVFYPPLIVPSLAFGTAVGTRIAYVFSLLLAGGGMYFFTRLLGPRPLLALWAGLLFAMNGGIIARIHAGHLQKVLAIPFIPLVLGCAVLMGRATSRRWLVHWALVTGLLHGFTFLAGDTYVPLFLLFAVPIIFTAGVRRGEGPLTWNARLLWGYGGWLGGLAIATAGKLIAASAVLSETIRSVNPYFGGQDSHWAIVHLAFPFFSAVPGLRSFSYGPEQVSWGWGWWEYTHYVGVVPVLLAALAFLVVIARLRWWLPFLDLLPRRREVVALLGILILGALWLANQEWYSPVHWLFEAVSPLQNFRVPSRPLMLAVPVVLALAAVGLEAVLRSNGIRPRAAFILIGALGLGGVWWVNTSWFTPFRWTCGGVPVLEGLSLPACAASLGILAVLGLGAFLFLASHATVRHRRLIFPVLVSLVAVTALADVWHATRAIPRVDEPSSAPAVRQAISELRSLDSGPFLVGLGTGADGFRGRNGFYINTPIRLQFADQGIAVAASVSPLLPNQQDRHNLIGLDKRMRYRVAPTELVLSEFVLSESSPWSKLMDDGVVVVLANSQAQGDAWIVRDDVITPLKVSDWGPGRFTVDADSPSGGTLVVPANAFRGWHVSIDGGPFQPAAELDAYVATPVMPGRHSYELVYRAPMLPLILVLGALPWVVLTALLFWPSVVMVHRHYTVNRSTT